MVQQPVCFATSLRTGLFSEPSLIPPASSTALVWTGLLHQCLTQHSYAYSLKQGQPSLALWFKQCVSVNRPVYLCGSRLLFQALFRYTSYSAVLLEIRSSQRLIGEWNTSQGQFVLCKENKLCSLEWKRGFNWTLIMSPMYAPLFCEVTGGTVFTLIMSGISFPHLHLAARIG